MKKTLLSICLITSVIFPQDIQEPNKKIESSIVVPDVKKNIEEQRITYFKNINEDIKKSEEHFKEMLSLRKLDEDKMIEEYHSGESIGRIKRKELYKNNLIKLNEKINNYSDIEEENNLISYDDKTFSEMYEPINAKLITGVMFPKKDMFSEKILNNGENLIIKDINNCKYLGKRFYNIDTERVNINLIKKSCLIAKTPVIKDVEGFVIEKDYNGVSTDFLNVKNGFNTLNSGKEVKVVITKIY